MSRGFYGIGVFHSKTEANIGTLWRSAFTYGAAFVFTIGRRYKRQSSDTVKTWRHIPLWSFADMADFREHTPYDAQLVCVETAEHARSLVNFVHPERAVYLLGAEDHGLPQSILAGNMCVRIPSARPFCLNVATAGSLVMYDRFVKAGIAKEEG